MNDVLSEHIERLTTVDIFKQNSDGDPDTGVFVGRPFYLDYDKSYILMADAWKEKAKGVPKGSFLLVYYANEENLTEAILLRVLQPATLPTDSEIIGSMVEYYKDNLRTAGENSQLDTFTKYEFSFSGVECRVLGTFYKNKDNKTVFGADLENFYSPHNYKVVKPNEDVLEFIVNTRESGVTGTPQDIRVGRVRYASSLRFAEQEPEVPVFVTPTDFLGKRTALFGMTRTGKSNTVKKVIQATVQMSQLAPSSSEQLEEKEADSSDLDPFTQENAPKYPCGQIIFDVNGEYANPNLQDEGTAIYELYSGITERYSVIEKPNFKVMKVNFFKDPVTGFEFVKELLGQQPGDYIQSVASIEMGKPDDYDSDYGSRTRYDRKLAAYLCCLYVAGFEAPEGFKVKFEGHKQINQLTGDQEPITPNASQGISLEDATKWFQTVWDNYNSADYFQKYQRENGREWADEDLKALLVFLTRKKQPNGAASISGYQKLRELRQLHTKNIDQPFETEVVKDLRKGKIIIVDLSQGSEEIQRIYSDRLCRSVFNNSMDRFISGKANNFIQFYFEEAHNLFPKKEDKELSGIYQRIAKEGAKLNIGLIYATQEVSSIATNILKNTQNWFISHLNNDDETKELRKFYDFSDFTGQLIRFSSSTDKGFIRMKTYSNPFVIPVQVDRFSAKR